MHQISGGLKPTHPAEEGGRKAQQRADREDDEGQLPTFGEADDEGDKEGGEGLDECPHLVSYALLDLIDVTVDRSMCYLNTFSIRHSIHIRFRY